MDIPDKRHKYLFWLLLSAFSVFFAEVFAGSDMFPFFHFWGLVVLIPFYGLHALLLLTLIYRHGRPRLAALTFGGMLFGLYEAYNTKVLWMPGWGDASLHVGDLALVETLVLVFWWHPWFAFITPTVLAERLLTGSREVVNALPLHLRRFYRSRWGWLALLAFGALFQSVNSPDVGQSLLSALGCILVLTLLVLWWRRATRGQVFTLDALLPDERQFRWLAVWLAGYYLFMTFAIAPERIPGLGGQAEVWLLYALAIWGFRRTLRRAHRLKPSNRQLTTPDVSRWWLAAAGMFVLLNPLAKAVFAGAGTVFALTGFIVGVLFGLWMFFRGLQQVLPHRKRKKKTRLHPVQVGNGRLSLYHRPGGGDYARFKQRGVTHLVTLLGEHESAPQYGKMAARHGLEWVWLPMPNAKYPQGEVHERLVAALPELARLLDEGAHLVIHCSAGLHRTGMVAYGLLRWCGYSPKAAMRAIKKMRAVTAREMHEKRKKWGDDLIAARQAQAEG